MAKPFIALIGSIVTLVIGLNFFPSIVAPITPILASQVSNESEVRMILRFVPLGLAVGLLGFSFAMAVIAPRLGGGAMNGQILNMIGLVLVLVIGIGLISTVIDAQNEAVDSVSSDITTTSLGSNCGTAGTTACAAADVTRVQGDLDTTETVLKYTALGYLLSLLAAGLQMANTASGGRAAGLAARAFRRR